MKFNLESTKTFDKNYGDVMSLKDFYDCCKSGGFIDYDGWARELIYNGKVINGDDPWETIPPSRVLHVITALMNAGINPFDVQIVWYNK